MGCDIHLYAEHRKDGRWVADKAAEFTNEGEDEENYWHMPSSFGDRNYALFGLLAKGVRREWSFAFEPRGLPDDMSHEVKELSDGWDVDGHNHSWLTLRELQEKRTELLLLSEQYAPEIAGYLAEMIESIAWPADANWGDHRVVFWFDN